VVLGERGLRGDGTATDPCENLQLLPFRHEPLAKKEHGTWLTPPLWAGFVARGERGPGTLTLGERPGERDEREDPGDRLVDGLLCGWL
jgi:hypothetical protein